MRIDKVLVIGGAVSLLAVPLYCFGSHYIWKWHGHDWSKGDGLNIRYLDRLGILEDLLLKVVAAYSIVNLVSHVIPKSVQSHENLMKISSFGFIGQAPRTLATPLYTHRVDFKASNVFPALHNGVSRQNGFSEEAIGEVFGSGNGVRTLLFAIMLGQVALNTAFITLNVSNLPDRDPTAPMNEGKHYICFLEALAIGLMWFKFIAMSLWTLCAAACAGGHWDASKDLAPRIRELKIISSISAFKCLPSASPFSLGKAYTDAVAQTEELGHPGMRYVAGIGSVLGHVAIGLVGLLSLGVKVSQLGFMEGTLYSDFKVKQVIILLGFASNVVSVYNPGDIEKESIQRFFVQKKEISLMSGALPIWRAWEANLGACIRDRLGACRAAVALSTLSANEIKRLLIPEQDYVPPLLHDIVAHQIDDLDALPTVLAARPKAIRERAAVAQAFVQMYPANAPPGTPYTQEALMAAGMHVHVHKASANLQAGEEGAIVNVTEEGAQVRVADGEVKFLPNLEYCNVCVFKTAYRLGDTVEVSDFLHVGWRRGTVTDIWPIVKVKVGSIRDSFRYIRPVDTKPDLEAGAEQPLLGTHSSRSSSSSSSYYN